MREVGRLLLLYGLLASVLKLFFPGVYFLFLYWVDQWGDAKGWAIRAGFMLLGAGLIAASWWWKRRKSQPLPGARI
ncbi:MAG TPA: hypothetical protein VEB22_02820 [Phycisphaerales bacterium]|nr:hypothetical protein [Phycisphaerales bacterium]